MRKQINFDMDGTLANFYEVNGWLEYIINEDATPYEVARPLLNLQALARVLNRLQREGWEINIISWLAKNGSKEYNEKVTNAKKVWLAKHLTSVKFNNITIVKYGTPKQTLGKGILFDDEEPNRKAWGVGAYDVQNIIEVLKKL